MFEHMAQLSRAYAAWTEVNGKRREKVRASLEKVLRDRAPGGSTCPVTDAEVDAVLAAATVPLRSLLKKAAAALGEDSP